MIIISILRIEHIVVKSFIKKVYKGDIPLAILHFLCICHIMVFMLELLLLRYDCLSKPANFVRHITLLLQNVFNKKNLT